MKLQFNEYILRVVISIGRYFQLAFRVLKISIKDPPDWSLIQYQMYHIGVLSLPVVAITGFSTGLLLAAQSFFQLSDKGLAGATGIMVCKAMATELGPIMTAFMVTGRVGASMCAEIGTMKVTEQIDAMISMAVNPLRYLISPRFIAGIAMLPFLTVFSASMGLLGGYLLSVHFFGMSPNNFLNPIPLYVYKWDIATGIIKSIIFGVLIVSISCYKGLRTAGGAAGVGRSTTQSVVICYSWILIINFLLTLVLNYVYVFFLGWR